MSTFELVPSPLIDRELIYFHDPEFENTELFIENAWIPRGHKKHYYDHIQQTLEAYNINPNLNLPYPDFLRSNSQVLPEMINVPLFLCMYLAPIGELQHYDFGSIPCGGRFCERCNEPSMFCLLPMPWQNRTTLPTDTSHLDRSEYMILCRECINRRCIKLAGCIDNSNPDPEERNFYSFQMLNLMPYRKIFGWPVFQSLLLDLRRPRNPFSMPAARPLPKCFGFFTVKPDYHQTKKAQ